MNQLPLFYNQEARSSAKGHCLQQQCVCPIIFLHKQVMIHPAELSRRMGICSKGTPSDGDCRLMLLWSRGGGCSHVLWLLLKKVHKVSQALIYSLIYLDSR